MRSMTRFSRYPDSPNPNYNPHTHPTSKRWVGLTFQKSGVGTP